MERAPALRLFGGARRAPQAGSPILAVHGAYKQTGRFHRAKVHVAADGVTAYNAHFSQA